MKRYRVIYYTKNENGTCNVVIRNIAANSVKEIKERLKLHKIVGIYKLGAIKKEK